jgi:hypothetical protein
MKKSLCPALAVVVLAASGCGSTSNCPGGGVFKEGQCVSRQTRQRSEANEHTEEVRREAHQAEAIIRRHATEESGTAAQGVAK